MPVYDLKSVQGTIPESIDPTYASVTDPLTTQLLRRAVGIGKKGLSLAGLDTPEGQIISMGNPMPLVSIYKDKAARLAGNAAFNARAEVLPQPIKDALEELAAKYPRIAAHIRPQIGEHPLRKPSFRSWVENVGERVKKPVTMSFTNKGIEDVTKEPFADMISKYSPAQKATDLVRHEATHVAQQLGNSDMGALYQASSLLGDTGTHPRSGYINNAFEIMARKAEPFKAFRSEAWDHVTTPTTQRKATDILREQADQVLSHRGPRHIPAEILDQENPDAFMTALANRVKKYLDLREQPQPPLSLYDNEH